MIDIPITSLHVLHVSLQIGFGSQGHFDKDIYAPAGSKYEGFVTSIGTNDEEVIIIIIIIIIIN